MHRAKFGVYQWSYGKTGKLLAAQAGTCLVSEDLDRRVNESQPSDRAQDTSMFRLDEMPPLSISAAEDLLSTIVHKKMGASFGVIPTVKDDMLLKLMSSFCVKINSLNKGIERSNTAIIRAVGGVMKERSSHSSILQATNNTRKVTEDNGLSLVVRRHAAATRKKTN